MKTYFEAHVTLTGDREVARHIITASGWRFSAIDGDANMGEGVKLYATRQYNARWGEDQVVKELLFHAKTLELNGMTILRRKVERVIYDDRSSLVRPCDGACPECIG